jgi:hypothetical protein
MTREDAEQFIAAQTERMLDCGCNGMTVKQRHRVRALDVVSPEDRGRAFAIAARLPLELGPAPHGDTGRMRVVNMHTGEIQIKRAPRRELDRDPGLDLEDDIAAVIV